MKHAFNLTGIVLGLVCIAYQFAPVVGEQVRAAEGKELSLMMKAAKEERAMKACLEGTSASYIVNGVRCKGFDL